MSTKFADKVYFFCFLSDTRRQVVYNNRTQEVYNCAHMVMQGVIVYQLSVHIRCIIVLTW